MIGKVFTKQICCGVASALGFSGSVYFVVKQTVPADPITTITVAPPASNKTIDLTDSLAQAKDITIDDIDTVFQLLREMRENGITPTFQELLAHRNKWKLLVKLLKQCDEENKKSADQANPVCKIENKEEAKKFLVLFLENAEAIKKMLDEDQKELSEEKKKDSSVTREPINELKAVQKLVQASQLSKTPEAIEATRSFLQDLQTMVTNKNVAEDEELKSSISSLIDFYTQRIDTAGAAKNPAPDKTA